jgi:hypothetical protein
VQAGLIGFVVNITTTAPMSTPAVSTFKKFHPETIPVLGILFWVPLALRRRRRVVLLALPLCSVILAMTACSGRSSGMFSPAPVPQKTLSSAGHYTVRLTGTGQDQVTGYITQAQDTDIGVTVQ